MKDSGCLDRFIFEKELNLSQYKILQNASVTSIKNIVLDTGAPDNMAAYNSEFMSTYKNDLKRYILFRGVPNYKMKDFLIALFNISKHEVVKNKPNSLKSDVIDKAKNFENLYFGRIKITSNSLNSHGMDSLNKILMNIREQYANITYCPLLPRVIQFFLWYIPEKLTYVMINLLIKENFRSDSDAKDQTIAKSASVKYFSTTMQFSDSLVRIGLSSNAKRNKKAKKIIAEMIDEMFVDIIPLEVIFS